MENSLTTLGMRWGRSTSFLDVSPILCFLSEMKVVFSTGYKNLTCHIALQIRDGIEFSTFPHPSSFIHPVFK